MLHYVVPQEVRSKTTELADAQGACEHSLFDDAATRATEARNKHGHKRTAWTWHTQQLCVEQQHVLNTTHTHLSLFCQTQSEMSDEDFENVTLMYDRNSSVTSVNTARLDLFAREQKSVSQSVITVASGEAGAEVL